jgi:hypothetical protein
MKKVAPASFKKLSQDGATADFSKISALPSLMMTYRMTPATSFSQIHLDGQCL